MDAAAELEAFQQNPLTFTQSVYFETSNTCQLSHLHHACPLHRLGSPPQHLPLPVYEHVLDTLVRYGFTGELRYHIMSEPLCDPRLFLMLQTARRALPAARVCLWTNGAFLSQTLCEELAEYVTTLITTAYSEPERERLSRLDVPMHHRMVLRDEFDKTLGHQYDADPAGSGKPCYAPLKRLSIGCDGSVMLCCRDWQKRHSFGSLKEGLAEVLHKPAVWDTYTELRRGRRDLKLCQRCARAR